MRASSPQARHVLGQNDKARAAAGSWPDWRVAGSAYRDAPAARTPPRRAVFDRAAGIEHEDLVADLRREPQIVGDEDERRCASLLLHLARSARTMRAWMVTSSAVVGSSATISRGPARKGHGDQHALAHAARELMRIALEQCRAAIAQMHARRAWQARARAARGASLMPRSRADARRTARPMVSTGLSADSGSCGTKAMSRPSSARRRAGAACDEILAVEHASAPPVTAKPGGSRCAIARPIIDLPAPGLADEAEDAAWGQARNESCREARGDRDRRSFAL